MVNKVILVGRLGRDPETRYTGSGQAVTNVSIATDEQWKDRNGERQSKTEWHKLVIWGKLGEEVVQRYCKKGQLIYVEGKIQSRDWNDKEGAKRTAFEIVVNTVKMLGGGRGASGESESAEDTSPKGHTPEISDEDIPF